MNNLFFRLIILLIFLFLGGISSYTFIYFGKKSINKASQSSDDPLSNIRQLIGKVMIFFGYGIAIFWTLSIIGSFVRN